MSDATTILFIDAATYFGYAVGKAGSPPLSGSKHFAKKAGATQAAVFWGAMRFTSEMIQAYGPKLIIRIEEPLTSEQRGGKSNQATEQLLGGLPACIKGMAYGLGCFDVDTIRVDKIRKHFIGANKKGSIAKPLVLQKCFALGWISRGDEDTSHDRSDACAGWSYAEHQLFPANSQPVDDLFVKMQAKQAGRIL